MKKPITLIALALLLSPFITLAYADTVTTVAPFNIYLNAGEAIMWQDTSVPANVTFSVITGSLNGSASLNADSLEGELVVIPATSGTLYVSCVGPNATVISVNGASPVAWPYSFTAGSPFTVAWIYEDAPATPTPSPSPTTIVTSPTPTATPIVTETIGGTPLYFRSDNQTTNTVNASRLDTTNTETTATIIDALTVSNMTYAFRVWIVHYDGSETEVTTGTPVANITRSSDGQGEQNATWSFPGATLDLGYDALKVVIYLETNAGWASRATYITPTLLNKAADASTWMFLLYTNKTGSTTTLSYGSSYYPSRIDGHDFTQPSFYELSGYYLQTGNILLFIFYGYTSVFGAAAYLLMLAIPFGTLYIRHRNTNVFLFLFTIFGGSGGLAWVFIPGWAAAVVDAILLIIGSMLVWRVLR